MYKVKNTLKMIILGIETSCDETSAAIVSDQREVLSHVLLSQLDEHKDYGGVIPEIAARSHLDHLDKVIKLALEKAALSIEHIDAVAATGGPGLIGGVIVGVATAKAIALAQGIPFIAVNHLAGHALTIRLTDDLPFPYLLLLVSGGHCQIIIVFSAIHYEILGETLDDALGEVFDKTARLLGLPYPGGPEIEKIAKQGDPLRFSFPRPLLNKKEPLYLYSFSFSGLKTAIRQTIEKLGNLTPQDCADCAASFQYTVGEILKSRVLNAIRYCQEKRIKLNYCVLAGGVASNEYLRQTLEILINSQGFGFRAPPLGLCTDNAAMIAWAGIEKIKLKKIDSLCFKPRPRWPLNEFERENP
jgi:N6-L-threonylcarbamoyladenine synthase